MNDIFNDDFDFFTDEEIEQHKQREIASQERATKIAQEEDAIEGEIIRKNREAEEEFSVDDMIAMNAENHSNRKATTPAKKTSSKTDKEILKDLGAGVEFGLAHSPTSAEAPPLSVLFLNNTATSSYNNGLNVKEKTRIVRDKKYVTISSNMFDYGTDFFLFLSVLNKINNDSITEKKDINTVTMTFSELDNLSFIADKCYRKRFNEKELKNVEDIKRNLDFGNITTQEAINKISKIKRVNQTYYELLTIKIRNFKITSKVYDKNTGAIQKDINFVVCSATEIDYLEETITFQIDSKFAKNIRYVGHNKFPSISLMRKMSDWEQALYLYIESLPDNETVGFTILNFIETTDMQRTVFKETTRVFNKALSSLEEKNYLKIIKKEKAGKGNFKYYIRKIK